MAGNLPSYFKKAFVPSCFDHRPWSPTGKPVVPKNHTHLRQGFGGSSAGERNPPKHDTLIVEMVYRALTHSSTAKAVLSCVGG
jgi:hypothetical protein